MSEYKYIIIFPIPEPFKGEVIRVMNEIERISGVLAPHRTLCPHVTFHRPISGLPEETLINIVSFLVRQAEPTKLRLFPQLVSYGKEFAALLVSPTETTAEFWVNLRTMLSKQKGYEPGKYDSHNTLHITMARNLTRVYDQVWFRIIDLHVEEMDILIDKIAIYRKPLTGGVWEELTEFPLSG